MCYLLYTVGRMHIYVEGAKVDGISLEKVLNEHMNRLEKLKPVPKVEESKKDLIENLEKLSKNLEISKESSVKCQESLKNLRTETLRKKSYEISQKQIEESATVDDRSNQQGIISK